MASFSKSALMASWSEVTKAFSLSEGIVLSFILSLPTEFFHQICRISNYLVLNMPCCCFVLILLSQILTALLTTTDSANKVAV